MRSSSSPWNRCRRFLGVVLRQRLRHRNRAVPFFVLSDRKAVARSRTRHPQETGRWQHGRVRAGHNRPGRAVPMLDQRLHSRAGRRLRLVRRRGGRVCSCTPHPEEGQSPARVGWGWTRWTRSCRSSAPPMSGLACGGCRRRLRPRSSWLCSGTTRPKVQTRPIRLGWGWARSTSGCRSNVRSTSIRSPRRRSRRRNSC